MLYAAEAPANHQLREIAPYFSELMICRLRRCAQFEGGDPLRHPAREQAWPASFRLGLRQRRPLSTPTGRHFS